MKSLLSGVKFTKPQLIAVEMDGIKVSFAGKNYDLPFKRYPWFEYCTLKELKNISFDGSALCWEDGVIDLEIDLLDHPEKEGDMVTLAGWLKFRKRVEEKRLYSEIAKKAGSVRSTKKAAASRRNGQKGGRPRKRLHKTELKLA